MNDRSRAARVSTPRLRVAVLAIVAAFLLVAVPAAEADWLITKEGERIQTIGPWQAEGDQLLYIDVGREQARVPSSQIDLEASNKATVEAGDVVLYSTSWCGYCRRTRALLNDLGVYFLEKDIEMSEDAHREFVGLVGPRSGIPVLKVENDVIRGYQPDVIKERTGRLEQADPTS